MVRWTRQRAGFYTLGAWSVQRVEPKPGEVLPAGTAWDVFRGAMCVSRSHHTLADAKVWAEAERERLKP